MYYLDKQKTFPMFVLLSGLEPKKNFESGLHFMNNPFALTGFFVYCRICQTDLRCSPFESLQI